MQEEVILYSPYKQQKKLHNYCDVKSPNFWTVVVSGRQAGKSTAAENQAVYWALSDDNSLTWYVAPTESQATKVYNDIVSAANGSGIIRSKKSSKGSIEIIWKNGSKTEFKSASSENSLRGSSVNYLILDEAAFIKKSTLEEIILPTLTAAGKKGLIISTPKGKNWLFNWYLKGIDSKVKNFKSLKFTSVDNPYSNKELIQSLKENMPDAVFQQEFMAEFVDGATVFKNIDDVSTMRMAEPIEGGTYHAGIDVGMLHDDTVITILNNDGHMVFYDAFTGLQSPEIKDRLLATLLKWKPISAKMEQNGLGLPILQLLQRDYPNIDGFITTNESKNEIINNLIAAFSSKEIRIIKDDFLNLQLQGFIFEMTPTGKIRYIAGSGFHDDAVMSLAIAWDSFVKNKMGSRYMVVSQGKFKPKFSEDGDSDYIFPNNIVQGSNYHIMAEPKKPNPFDDF